MSLRCVCMARMYANTASITEKKGELAKVSVSLRKIEESSAGDFFCPEFGGAFTDNLPAFPRFQIRRAGPTFS